MLPIPELKMHLLAPTTKLERETTAVELEWHPASLEAMLLLARSGIIRVVAIIIPLTQL